MRPPEENDEEEQDFEDGDGDDELGRRRGGVTHATICR